jgi:hypothetical protein
MANVDNDTLKTAFRHVCDVMLENGLDLEQAYKDQDPNLFIEKGIVGTYPSVRRSKDNMSVLGVRNPALRLPPYGIQGYWNRT